MTVAQEKERIRIRNLTRQTMSDLINQWMNEGMPNRHGEQLDADEAQRILARLTPVAMRQPKLSGAHR